MEHSKLDSLFANNGVITVSRGYSISVAVELPKNGMIGVRPALYLDSKQISIEAGDGSKEQPFIVSPNSSTR